MNICPHCGLPLRRGDGGRFHVGRSDCNTPPPLEDQRDAVAEQRNRYERRMGKAAP